MASEFIYSRRVQFAETDLAGIAHFSNYFRWMEEAEHAFFRSLGLSVSEKRDGEEIGWPRIEVSCEYRQPARFEDVLTVGLRVTRKSTKSIAYEFRITNQNQEELAAGRMVTVCCRCKPDGGIEAIPIPPEIREKIEAGAESTIQTRK